MTSKRVKLDMHCNNSSNDRIIFLITCVAIPPVDSKMIEVQLQLDIKDIKRLSLWQAYSDQYTLISSSILCDRLTLILTWIIVGRSDILIRNPRGFGRQVILDFAVTGVESQSRVDDNDPHKPLDDRHKQKLNWYQNIGNQNDFQFVPFIFSHIGETHGEIKHFIEEQIHQQLIIAGGEAKVS